MKLSRDLPTVPLAGVESAEAPPRLFIDYRSAADLIAFRAGKVHTVRESMGGVRLGADWTADELGELAGTCIPIEIGGPLCRRGGHGLIFHDRPGRQLFVATRAGIDWKAVEAAASPVPISPGDRKPEPEPGDRPPALERSEYVVAAMIAAAVDRGAAVGVAAAGTGSEGFLGEVGDADGPGPRFTTAFRGVGLAVRVMDSEAGFLLRSRWTDGEDAGRRVPTISTSDGGAFYALLGRTAPDAERAALRTLGMTVAGFALGHELARMTLGDD